MSLTKSLKSKNYLYLLFFNLFVFNLNFAQCDTPNFTVTKINGTCQSNGSIAVTVPSSLDCSGWIAELVRTSDGNSTQLSIPTNGGTITFTSLTPNNYNVFLTNGITTFSYTQNPVNISTSYVPMTVSTTSTAPSCRTTAANYAPDGNITINIRIFSKSNIKKTFACIEYS